MTSNADMGVGEIRKFCKLDVAGETLMRSAMRQLQLSARAFHRVLKIARTVADLAGSDPIAPNHLAEALQYPLPPSLSLSLPPLPPSPLLPPSPFSPPLLSLFLSSPLFSPLSLSLSPLPLSLLCLFSPSPLPLSPLSPSSLLSSSSLSLLPLLSLSPLFSPPLSLPSLPLPLSSSLSPLSLSSPPLPPPLLFPSPLCGFFGIRSNPALAHWGW